MRVHTLRFGEIDVPQEAVLHFSDGILGFPGLRRCCLLPHTSAAGIRWLQSLDDPALAFLTVEPHLIFPGYEIELPDADALALDLTDAKQAAVLTLITISQDVSAATANLLAPIVINTRTCLARQVILETDRYLTKHLIAHQLTDEADAGIDAKTR